MKRGASQQRHESTSKTDYSSSFTALLEIEFRIGQNSGAQPVIYWAGPSPFLLHHTLKVLQPHMTFIFPQ